MEQDRLWLVTIVVQREVMARNNIDAMEQLTEPIKEAFGDGEAGIIEGRATALLPRQRSCHHVDLDDGRP